MKILISFFHGNNSHLILSPQCLHYCLDKDDEFNGMANKLCNKKILVSGMKRGIRVSDTDGKIKEFSSVKSQMGSPYCIVDCQKSSQRSKPI
jgi:hypothetical protein